MTCIVGLAEVGGVRIGGDSAAVAGWDMIVRSDSKVFANGGYIFGFTTSFRMGQLLRHGFTPPDPPAPTVPVHGFMCTTFVDAVRDCLKRGGYAKKHDEREESGTFMVGVAGRLFVVSDDYQVAESLHGFAAIGCGAQVALGSLFATEDRPLSGQRRLEIALEAAERFSAGVRAPFTFVSQSAR